jgi:flagellar biosynthesis protein FlhF
MKVRSYITNTVEEAVEKARRELGAEALLLNTRSLERTSNARGRYEVAFAVPAGAEAPAPAATAPPPATEDTQLAELRRKVEQLAQRLRPESAPTHEAVPAPAVIPQGNHFETFLLNRGIAPDLARTLVQEAGITEASLNQESPSTQMKALLDVTGAEACAIADATAPTAANVFRGGTRLEQRFFATLRKNLKVLPAQEGDKSQRILLLGASGAGKTTAIMKLAIREGIAAGRTVRIFSLDTRRLGAQEEMKVFCRIANIDFIPVLSTDAAFLRSLYSETHGLTLIDTPGLNASDEGSLEDLAQWMKRVEGLTKILVLPASQRLAMQQLTIRRYARFAPTALLLSRLDEPCRGGELLGLAMQHQLPVSWLSFGASIPEDLETASEDRLLGILNGATVADEKRPNLGMAPDVQRKENVSEMAQTEWFAWAPKEIGAIEAKQAVAARAARGGSADFRTLFESSMPGGRSAYPTMPPAWEQDVTNDQQA